MSRLCDVPDSQSFVRSMRHAEPFSSSAAFDGWDLAYTQLSSGQFRCDSQEVRFGGVQIYTEASNATMHQTGAAWENAYTFIVPCEMREAGRVNGVAWHTAIVAFRGEHEFNARVPPMNLLAVSISQTLVESCWGEAEASGIARRLRLGLHLAGTVDQVEHAARDLVDVMNTCVAQPDMLNSADARVATTHALLDVLMPFVADEHASQMMVCGPHNRTRLVRQAREFALASIDASLRIVDLCRALGVSRRALQYCFEQELGVSPVTYLRLLRLNGARRDLLYPDASLQVKDVAARWGFWHWSRFSAEYRHMYGELPSQTLQASRQG
ncbi:helix-turn-helix domain-containing protein [Paraburkholderia sp. 1N]|uniref:Helix-turn-helix domain-containing protein n=1 Tax=Paraburkholderia solitsugae TaxID=2675748 RepID=A0ABX2BM52_9BURK|nr:helix-turn-helix domain-containing protein [Paraburkholderia solitsugae]NPT40991.1 helix-turn-helix domain-containing protein [Paraburkholderia solitsugae]